MITFLTSSENLTYNLLFVPMNFIKRMYLNIRQTDKKYEQVKDLFKVLSSEKIILGDSKCFTNPRYMLDVLGGQGFYGRLTIKPRHITTLPKLTKIIDNALFALDEKHTILLTLELHADDTFTPHGVSIENDQIKRLRKISIDRLMIRMGDA